MGWMDAFCTRASCSFVTLEAHRHALPGACDLPPNVVSCAARCGAVQYSAVRPVISFARPICSHSSPMVRGSRLPLRPRRPCSSRPAASSSSTTTQLDKRPLATSLQRRSQVGAGGGGCGDGDGGDGYGYGYVHGHGICQPCCSRSVASVRPYPASESKVMDPAPAAPGRSAVVAAAMHQDSYIDHCHSVVTVHSQSTRNLMGSWEHARWRASPRCHDDERRSSVVSQNAPDCTSRSKQSRQPSPAEVGGFLIPGSIANYCTVYGGT